VPAGLLSTYSYGEASANGVYTGNTQLKPEVADTYTVGFVLTPHFHGDLDRDLGASVDYYHIKINGAVGAVTGDLVLQSCFNANGANPTYSNSNFFCQQISRDQTSGSLATLKTFEENIGSYTTDGVDIQAHWGFPLRALGLSDRSGRVLLQTYVSYLRSLRVVGLGTPSVNLAGSIADTYSAIAADGASISDLSHPNWKANTMLGYANGPVGVALHWRFISSMADLMDGVNSGDAGVPAYSYFDLNGHYQLDAELQIRAGITNLFDKKEPFVAGAPLLTDAATYDIFGRQYFVGFTADFD
jgi:outer membrane receptor protein involved in Fe transport